MILVGIAAAVALVAARWSNTSIPDTVDFVGNAVVATAEGQVLWRYAVNRPDDAPPGATWRSSGGRLVDMTGDGAPEVAALVTLVRGNERFVRNEFLLLAPDGELLWRYTPQASFRFGEETFDGPWRIDNWIVTDGPGGPHVWLSVIHHVWWPSFIVAIDRVGEATTRFVHPGHIYSLAQLNNQQGNFIVAAGINNEYASAMLAVLDEQGPTVEPPSADSHYQCQGGPHAKPVRYLLFPRSELNSLLGQPYNRVDEAAVNNGGRIDVSVQEGSEPHLRAVYRLSSVLLPESVGLSDSYWQTHRGLERAGRLDHAAENCPDRDGMKVRMWEAEGGWSEQMVSASHGR